MESPSLMTAERHILDEQRQHHPEATGEFSWVLSGILLATKVVAAEVRRAGLVDVLGSAERKNIQGEEVQKLDVLANNALQTALASRGSIAVMASEENEQPIIVSRDRKSGRYVVVFDPLDGSSNIDVCVSVGTIFSILRREPDPTCKRDPLIDVLQPGLQQVAVGYVVYGSSTVLVYSTGRGVHGFTLDPSIGAYLLSHPNIQMPPCGNTYSVNEANMESFPRPYQRLIAKLKSGETGRKYSSRYIGSLVADFHRTLLKGGIFLYPPTAAHPSGKLRLMYEVNPIAMLAEQSGGKAVAANKRILEIQPTDLHQRVPLVVGSREEVELFEQLQQEDSAG